MILKFRNRKPEKAKNHPDIHVLVFAFFYAINLACWAQPIKVYQEELRQYYPKRLITNVELMVGPSFVYARSDDFVLDGKLSISAGLGLEHEFNSNFSVKVNFLYEIKGYKQKLSGINMDSGYARPSNSVNNLTLSYVSISPLAIYHFPLNRFSLGCGPYFGYLINSMFYQETYINGSLTSIYRRRLLSNELYKSYDLGLSAIVSYSILKRRLVTINLIYNHGLMEINIPPVSSYRNNSIVLVLAYPLSRYSSRSDKL